MRSRTLAAALLAPALLALGACGDDSQPSDQAVDPASTPASASTTASASSTASAPSSGGSLPDCARLWVEGATIPEHYAGCSADGSTVKAAKTLCDSGQTVVTYAGRYYGVLGGPVNDVGSLSSSAVYQKVVRSCR